MSDYLPGETEDDVIKVDSKDLDLTVFIEMYQQLELELKALEQHKDTPDQETLDYWNQSVDDRNAGNQASIDERAVFLYEAITPIKDAGLLPSKYDDEYNKLQNYVNNL